MAEGYRILVVEDDAAVRRLVTTTLDMHGYAVREAKTATQALLELSSQAPDLAILDLGLPDGDGVDVIRSLRGWSALPVIVLSARLEDADKVAALDAGADDYLAKPFGMMELVSRVNALLRRASAPSAAVDDQLTRGPIVLVASAHTVHVDGVPVTLTLKEFDLLQALMQNAGHVLSRSQLLEDVWGITYVGETRTVDVHIQTLRQKLAAACGGSDAWIHTVRGVGYCAKQPS